MIPLLVQHCVKWGCYNILLQDRCIQILLFPICHSRMEQTWYANKKIKIFLSFKNSVIKIGRRTAKPTYNIHNPIGLKFLTRLRPGFGLSHLNKHKFKHSFQDCVNPCACVVWRLNPFPISFCTVIILQNTCNALRWFAVRWYKYPKFFRHLVFFPFFFWMS